MATLYELIHHVKFAKHHKVTNDEINIMQTEHPVVSLVEEGNLLYRGADEICRDVRLRDESLSLILERCRTWAQQGSFYATTIQTISFVHFKLTDG